MARSSLLAEADIWLRLHKLDRVEGGPSAVSVIERLLAALSDAEGDAERLAERLYALSKKWAAEAHEIDQDGDFCCAETRRNDAGELFDLLRDAAPRPERLN